MEYLSHNPSETEAVGAQLAKQLKPGDFIAMYGNLGAGKTAFARGVASVLVPHAQIQSPTYTMIAEYRTNTLTFCHCDMYRITSEDDLYSIGFFDNPDAIFLVEWCEKIPYAIPPAHYQVTIAKHPEHPELRTITILSPSA